MSIIVREDPGLSQKQRLGKAFGICRAKEGHDFILGRINDFLTNDIEKKVNVKTFIRTSKKGKASIVGKFERRIEKKKITKPYNSRIPAFNLLANAFDLLLNKDKLDILLANLSDEEIDFLYEHPINKEIEGLLP